MLGFACRGEMHRYKDVYLLECLHIEVGPIAEGPRHHHAMHVVELMAEVPRFLQVIDLELNIRRNAT